MSTSSSINGSPARTTPVEIVTLLFALTAEPRPAPPAAADVSLELLEYLGGIDTAPAWIRNDATERRVNDDAPAPRPVRPSTERSR